MTWEIFIRLSHVIGTVLGVGGETFATIFYFKALQDGKVDLHESATLRTCFAVLHVGLIILVLSGFGFFVEMRFDGTTKYMFSARLIAKMALVVILLVNAILMQTRKLPEWIGGAISITSWYAALILGVWRGLHASLWQMILVYLATIVVVMIGERLIRKRLAIAV